MNHPLHIHDIEEEGSDQMGEVGELTVPHTGDSREQDFIRLDKSTNDVEQSAVKLLASRHCSRRELVNLMLKRQLDRGYNAPPLRLNICILIYSGPVLIFFQMQAQLQLQAWVWRVQLPNFVLFSLVQSA